MVSETEVIRLHRDDAAVSMTIALIADIHGNLAALEAVLDALRAEPTDRSFVSETSRRQGRNPARSCSGCTVLGVPW